MSTCSSVSPYTSEGMTGFLRVVYLSCAFAETSVTCLRALCRPCLCAAHGTGHKPDPRPKRSETVPAVPKSRGRVLRRVHQWRQNEGVTKDILGRSSGKQVERTYCIDQALVCEQFGIPFDGHMYKKPHTPLAAVRRDGSLPMTSCRPFFASNSSSTKPQHEAEAEAA